MANRRATFAKRQRESDLKDRAKAKDDRRNQKRTEVRPSKGPEIAWAEAVQAVNSEELPSLTMANQGGGDTGSEDTTAAPGATTGAPGGTTGTTGAPGAATGAPVVATGAPGAATGAPVVATGATGAPGAATGAKGATTGAKGATGSAKAPDTAPAAPATSPAPGAPRGAG